MELVNVYRSSEIGRRQKVVSIIIFETNTSNYMLLYFSHQKKIATCLYKELYT